MIKIRNLRYIYPDKRIGLDGISLNIKEDITGIIGPNGAGKTTLLLHLNGVLQPTQGSLTVDDIKVNPKSMSKIRKKVGIVFQNPDDMLFSPTVYEDVAFGPTNLKMNNIHARVHLALEQVGMAEYETQNPHHMSLGQKKRVSLAAVIVMEPEYIIFDEPTTHLDPQGKREIIKLILSLNTKRIISTHDMNLLKYCNEIHILNNGKLVHSSHKVNKATLKEYGLF
ncbi:energy-coupling factor ABC transporter ATP-binding protein [Candidatus Woesearchaeota archaeon]|nr:energy-coupling factor ABC transporter ATP-binding protein [Candidatus Woesearchaeota archaeon]